MQKNYRDYTVGELLDMGLRIDVHYHRCPSKKDGMQLLSRFEGVKRSSDTIVSRGRELDVLDGWKGNFRLTIFIPKNEK
ncbi:hypothetical protein [Oceanobacillus caeni]|uniref:hypothetical protein n=1 Tax=Oceanobacillus caeni TaxID=405946 RepID=UPI0036403943